MAMEVHDRNPFSVYVVTSVFFVLFILFKLVQSWGSNNSSTNLPPGPSPLPLIGNLHQLLGSLPHRCLKNLADKYGPLMHLKLGEVSNIVITSAELAQEIMKTHDANFSNRPNLVSSRTVSYNNSNIVFAPYGEYWRQVRKICTVELLTAKRVQSFRSIREEEVSELVKKIAASEGRVFNLSQNIFPMTYGTAARAAFGKRSRYQQVFISKIEEQLKLLGGFSLADLYPSSRVLEMLAKAKFEKIHGEIDRVLQDIIDEHRQRSSSECEAVEDLVDVLLRYQQQNDSESHFTDDNLKAVIRVSLYMKNISSTFLTVQT